MWTENNDTIVVDKAPELEELVEQVHFVQDVLADRLNCVPSVMMVCFLTAIHVARANGLSDDDTRKGLEAGFKMLVNQNLN